nr:recombinase family protein [Pseudoponticoccus marisrubri]
MDCARVTTGDQFTDSQIDALASAGPECVFADAISGAIGKRPELDRLLDHLRSGNVFAYCAIPSDILTEVIGGHLNFAVAMRRQASQMGDVIDRACPCETTRNAWSVVSHKSPLIFETMRVTTS